MCIAVMADQTGEIVRRVHDQDERGTSKKEQLNSDYASSYSI